MKIKIVIALIFLGFISCAVSNNISIYTVASKTTIGYGAGPMKCMFIKEGDSQDWNMFYSSIEGFDYEEGYEYVIKVRKEKIKNPPADGSSIKYILIKVISKERKESKDLPAINTDIEPIL